MLIVIAGFVAGLLIGSFLNVVAWGLPRGESLVRPASSCPACRAPIKPYDNVPVVSWLLLRGRCRHCGEEISPRYPLVELATALLYALVVAVADRPVDIALGLLLVPALVPITLIDLDLRLIPNRITLPAAVAAVVAGVVLDVGSVPEQLIAGSAAGGFFLPPPPAVPPRPGHGRR